MIKLELDAIHSHLRSKGIDIHLQAQTSQLYLLLKIAETEFPVFIRIFDGDELLQLLTFIPCNFTEATTADTARLLHLLNKEMDIPGFGMDENAGVVFYRCMLPANHKKIDAALLDAYLNTIDVVCKSFAPVITAVSHGALSFNEVLKNAKQNQALINP